MADLRHNPDLDEAFGETSRPRETLTQAQIDALTQALNDLTRKVETAQQQQPGQRAGQTPFGQDIPWWFKYTPGKPGAPNELPPWHYAYGQGGMMGIGAGGGPPRPPWWNRYASAMGEPGGDPEPDPEKHSFVRGHWRMKRVRAKRQRGANAFEDLFEPKSVPEATEYKSPGWKRKLKADTWFTRFTRRAGARVGGRFGRKAGRATQQGLGAAAQSLMWGGSVQYAARRGIAAAAMAGGPVAAGVAILGMAAVKAAESLNQMTREQVEYNRHLAQNSAQMAFVVSQRDMSERMRDRELGDRLSNSARVLMRAEQFNKDQTKEMDVFWERAKNYVGAGWEVFKSSLFWQLELQAKALNWIAEKIEGTSGEEKPFTFDQWVRQAQQTDAEGRKRKDPKWDPPKFR